MRALNEPAGRRTASIEASAAFLFVFRFCIEDLRLRKIRQIRSLEARYFYDINENKNRQGNILFFYI